MSVWDGEGKQSLGRVMFGGVWVAHMGHVPSAYSKDKLPFLTNEQAAHCAFYLKKGPGDREQTLSLRVARLFLRDTKSRVPCPQTLTRI